MGDWYPKSLYSRVGVVALGVLVVLATVSGSAAGATSGSDATATGHNQTIHHERPENVSEHSDLGQVSRWLEGRLGRRLQDSTLKISDGQYRAAQSVIGDRYDERLRQYIDVAGQTSDSSDDDLATAMKAAGDHQREYAESVAAFRTHKQAYQAAKREGDDNATIHARQMVIESRQIERLNESLVANYRVLANRTDISERETAGVISQTTADVLDERSAVTDEVLIETEMVVQANESTVSFADPVRMLGRLRTAADEPVAKETIPLAVGAHRYETTTDSRGRFSFQYRPVSLPANTSTVTVAYAPQESAPYLGTTERVDVEVAQVTPTIELDVSPTTARYGDRVRVTGNVTVDGEPVPGYDLAIEGDDGRFASASSTAAGNWSTNWTVPASVAEGPLDVRAAGIEANRAVAVASARDSLRIESTPTNLTADARATESAVLVTGTLQTVRDSPVDGQRVAVTVRNQRVTARTDESGAYRATVDRESLSATSNESLTLPITARFDGRGSNLGQSTAETSVTITRATTAAGEPAREPGFLATLQTALGGRFDRTTLLGAGAALLAMALLGGVLVRRRSDPPTSTEESRGRETPFTLQEFDDAASFHEAWIEFSRDALDAGDAETAVVTAYAETRRQVETHVDVGGPLTTREFIDACTPHLDAGDVQSLRVVSEAYEQVRFASDVSETAARSAVEAADEFLVAEQSESTGE